ncbi:MAG: hypothetical protein ACR2KG_06755 [Nocardioidaceae bacterium]
MLFSIAFAALAWVVLVRPAPAAHKNGMLLQNMVRDSFVPWNSIAGCRVAQTLQVATRDKVITASG